jgi:hypothetical protein
MLRLGRAAHAAQPSRRMATPAIEGHESVPIGHDFVPVE